MIEMETKKCPHCNQILTIDNFSYKDKSHTKLSSWCKECIKEKSKEIRKNNIEKYRKKARDNKNKFYKIKREKLNEYKKGGCIICGEKELVCLDFHHLDSSEKDFDIGKQFHIKQFSKIEEEIKKCVVLCANCHRKVHANIIKLQV